MGHRTFRISMNNIAAGDGTAFSFVIGHLVSLLHSILMAFARRKLPAVGFKGDWLILRDDWRDRRHKHE